jgi:hypothetical protein
MENTKTNFYISRLDNWILILGREKAIQRAIQNLCSLLLSKNFGETAESFYDRKPEILEYSQYIQFCKISE